jgi:phosphoribosyl 1,2-cyclic phosphate 1,2-diphosphodiesterase
MIKADMHIHCTVSDGSYPLKKILDDAKTSGLTHISLTDHDTTAGVSQVTLLAKTYGIAVIPGVEFSAFDYANNIRAHILGYGMKDFTPIEQLGSELLNKRHENSLRQIEILRSLGYNISVEEVSKKAGRHIYKQHIMHVMVEKGYAKEIGGEMFRTLFKNNGPCDFDIMYIDARDAIKAVKEAGGASVLAHPGQQGNFSSISMLVRAGLDGLEMNHHSNTRLDRQRILDYSQCFGLLLTGGSDCHGLYEVNSPAVGSWLCPEMTIDKMRETGLC